MSNEKPEILIIDDDRMDRSLLEQMLILLGYSNLGVKDASTALEHLKTGSFRLVLSEWKLFQNRMFEKFTTLNQLVTAIRTGEAGEQNVDIPVVAVTANFFSCPAHTIKAVGLNGVVYKPFNVADLRNAVASCIYLKE